MRFSLQVLLLVPLVGTVVAGPSSSTSTPWGVNNIAVAVRGGASSSSSKYATQLDTVKDKVLKKAETSMDDLLRSKIVDEATVVDDFGSVADTIINNALEDFANKSAESDSGSEDVDGDLYDSKLLQVEAALEQPLLVLYLKQLALLRDEALRRFQKAASAQGSSEYEAMLQADAYFAREAEACVPSAVSSTSASSINSWDYTSDRAQLQSIMNSIVKSQETATNVRLQAGQQQQTAMQVLQQQQQMIQQLQMQLYGQTSPWNVGVAYRIPDTNFNLQGSYQQGKTNVQLSCVPDEYAAFLGPNGFTQGVGPGNLGLSLNLSV
eukprot:CAMPEP_0113481576 /NCGR_PEP_ID=MMETSP0014_2-20120614/22480_1 /TAXON_ID=2857 /ORGANISM="Nitzschia sp." /LENGTH=322 /DNA_ID=CAMNT_0000375077 /DNA_START=247 /DNA_END=1215 /DNA_ORIENTATION=+ /assembly_acc=CAM_ASM_000159